jgi:hypothetical protein
VRAIAREWYKKKSMIWCLLISLAKEENLLVYQIYGKPYRTT